MILSLITIPLISQLMVYLFNSNTLKKNQDYFMCIVNIPDDEAQVSPNLCNLFRTKNIKKIPQIIQRTLLSNKICYRVKMN